MGCTHCKATWQNVGLLNHWVNNRNGSPVNFRFIWNQCKQRQFCDSISATLCDQHLPYNDMFTQKFNLYKKNVSELKVTSSNSNSLVWNSPKTLYFLLDWQRKAFSHLRHWKVILWLPQFYNNEWLWLVEQTLLPSPVSFSQVKCCRQPSRCVVFVNKMWRSQNKE